MATKIEIKEEESHITSQNEREFFVTMKRNSDDVAIKTEIKSETTFTKHHRKEIKSETEIEEQTLISDFGSQNKGESLSEDSVMKDNKYKFDDEMEYKIDIKEEPLWVETDVCDDIKDGDFPPVKSSRLRMEAVSDADSGKLPFSSAEVSRRHTGFSMGNDHLECVRKKSDVTEIPTAEEHVLKQSAKHRDTGKIHRRPLYRNKKCSIHEGKRPHKCKTCDKSFTHLGDFKRHNLIHEDKKPHQCKSCDKSFTQLAHLKRHTFIHEGEKPLRCKTCDKTFIWLSTLKKHNMIHEGKKPHQCNRCDMSFIQIGDLKRHYFIHEGKKPHQCKICGRRFTQTGDLKRHNFIHEGKKPHQCKTCDKSFTLLGGLKRHNMIHEGKKPHQCKFCGRSFTQLSNLKTHNLIHKGKK